MDHVKVCINSVFPGGLEASLASAFEDGELLDYYSVNDDGTVEHEAQMRKCMGGCAGPAESVVRRGVEKMIVRSISSGSFLTLHLGGVRIYLSSKASVRESLHMLIEGSLRETEISEYSSLSRKIE